MTSYIGVSNAKKTLIDIYVGVSNSPKEVLRAYVGVSNSPKIVYQKDWWSAQGAIAASNVLAAFNFKGAASETAALKDLTGHGNNLSKSGATWSTANGFNLSPTKYLDNSSLRSNSRSIIMKISSGGHGGGALPLGSCGGLGLWLSTPFCTQSFWYEVSGLPGVTHQNGLSVEYRGGAGNLPMNYVRIGSSFYGGHVLGFTYSGETLYANGSAISLNNASYNREPYWMHGNWTGFICSQVPRLAGGYNDGSGSGWSSLSNVTFAGSFNVEYLAVYSTNLTAALHSVIASDLNNM